ncbi:MAG: SUMF1/EgtB/PvdO family nonheme iron enzyme [Verrucomicrobia bacterium]|nr:SUMF1/EgtB/PvdO family nonheme iron enzyme [Verrucomicrobiota bacterium]
MPCCCLAVLPLAAQTNPIAIFPDEDALTPENLRLVWPATPGLRYEVKQSTNLQSWSTAPGYPATASGPAQQMPFLTDGKARFFRVRELDEQPPAIVSQFPQDGGFAVPRFANLTLQLSDVTGINTNSIRLTVGSLGTFTLTNTNLTWTNGLLTFINGGSIPLGGWGSNVLASLIVADTLGNRGTNTWSFSLETQPQVVTNLFVFGSPQAQRTGQRIGNIPTAALAARVGPIPMSDGDPWTLELVESNRLVVSYTNTAPGFATNTYVCNLTPVRPADIFNRKILSITNDPGNKRLTLFTVEVPLTEIATNGAATISANSVVLQTGTNGAFAKAFQIGSTITFPRIGYSLDGAEFKLKDSVGEFDIVNLTLEEQHWWLTPRLQVALELNWGKLKRFSAIASGNVDAASVWNVDLLLAGVALETTLFDLPEALKPKTWMLLGFVGPVPVYASLGLDVQLKARAEAHATLSFRAGLRQTLDGGFGVTYNDSNVQWVNTLHCPTPEVIPFTANINAEGSLTVSLEPALEFLVYGLAGVSAGITPSADIVFAVGTGQPLSGKLDADVTLDLGLAGPGFDWLNPKPELSLSLWHDEWHLFPNDTTISFTEQPQSQSVQVGHSAYFFATVAASGTPSYQWFFNDMQMVGQTARTLSLPSVSSGHTGNYKVRVTAGRQTADSAPATLTVIQPQTSPQIVLQPQGQSVGVGAAASFSVQAQGGGTLSYQWSKDGVYLTDGVRITGSTGTTLQIANVQASDAGNYRARISNQAGSVVSSSAGLTLLTSPSGMALIPAGSFTMGNCMDPNEGWSGELPLHSVYVSAFYMDVNLVSYSQWLTVYNWAITHGYSFDYAGSGKASTHPVQSIDWYDCVKWCNARSEKEGKAPAYYMDAGLSVRYRSGQVGPYVNWSSGYRLPTEAEWEKAARGGASGQRFPWGNTISWGQANYYAYPLSAGGYPYDVNGTSGYHATFNDGVYPYTSPVGYFAANGYGLYDMAGNVWQWCWDWYGSYSSGSQTDPRGATSGSFRVIRCGCWYYGAYYCRAAYRNDSAPDRRDNSLGFRSALPSGQ